MSLHWNSVCSKATKFWFVPSECQSNPLHSNWQIWLHNHILQSRIWNSDFPIPPKLALANVKSFPSNCFFFVTTSLKSSIKFPIKSFLLVVRPWNKDSCMGWVKSKIDWKCSEISTFWLTSKFKPVFFIKVRIDFFKKDYNQKIYVCKVVFDWKTKNFNRYTRKTTL